MTPEELDAIEVRSRRMPTLRAAETFVLHDVPRLIEALREVLEREPDASMARSRRLREALESVRDCGRHDMPQTHCTQCRDIVRAALAEEPKP